MTSTKQCQYRCMQQDADPAWQDILGETVVRVGGAVHPVLFLQKRAAGSGERISIARSR